MEMFPKEPCFDGFYIWFNPEKKEEYFLASLYSLGDLLEVSMEDMAKLRMSFRRTANSVSDYKLQEETFKLPYIYLTPYVEKLGMLLINFLNADFSCFEAAYDSFYCYYGTDLLHKYTDIKRLEIKYPSEVIVFEKLKELHSSASKSLVDIQKNFKKTIDFLFNLNKTCEYEEYSPQIKFIAAIMKKRNNIDKYISNTKVINYSYTDKAQDYKNISFDDLLKDISYDTSILNVSDIYTSEFLGDICFIVLAQIIQNGMVIRTCQNCGKYFIPNKLNEIYCDFIHSDGTTCRDKGAGETYKKNLESVPGLLEYRRIYHQKFNKISRNKDNKELREDFDKWKKLAQSKVKEYKEDSINSEDLLKWMIENK